MRICRPHSSRTTTAQVTQAQRPRADRPVHRHRRPRDRRSCGIVACHAEAQLQHCTRRHQLAAFSGALAAASLHESLGSADAAEPVEASIGEFRVTVRYDKFAKEYDRLDNGVAARSLGFPELRQQVVREAQGDVLETGAGTGINLPFYHHGMIRKLTAIDQSVPMLEQAVAKVRMMAFAAPMDFVSGDVHHMPFEDNSFDAVVDTFSLCVYEDPLQALKEMARVLRPGGKLLLLEHARSDNAVLGAYQDLTAPAIAAMSKGCLWNQNLSVLLKSAGLYPIKEDHHLGGTISAICAVSTIM